MRTLSAGDFAAGWAECHGGGRRVIDALTTMAARLGANSDAYRARDDRLASDLNVDRPELPG